MATPKRSARPGTYFITSKTFQGRRLFQVDANAELFLETLQDYRKQGCYKLHAFIAMPDHIHLLLTPQGLTLERVIGMIKGGFSFRLSSNFSVWQEGLTDHRIRDREDFVTHRNYIHQNPVRAGLVERAEDYKYSSAYRPVKENDTSAAKAAL